VQLGLLRGHLQFEVQVSGFVFVDKRIVSKSSKPMSCWLRSGTVAATEEAEKAQRSAVMIMESFMMVFFVV
jgi:hypothetical protein